MIAFILRRAGLAIPTLIFISFVAFVIIQLPPGDYITSYIAQMSASGGAVSEQEADALRQEYSLDKPLLVQYLRWMKQVLQGRFGMALEWRRPVSEVIGDRLWLTMVVSVAAILLTWLLALPIGIYSAVRQYSAGDYVAIMGSSGSGKSTLLNELRARGYTVSECLQEHSHVPDMWRRLRPPDVLIYLDASLDAIRQRRPHSLGLDEKWLAEERRRLRHARELCNLYFHTDTMPVTSVPM